jgi:hypothetical protein
MPRKNGSKVREAKKTNGVITEKRQAELANEVHKKTRNNSSAAKR